MRGIENFDNIIKGLNHAQHEAVKTLEGPVMVLAGPGTGKTQILAARIANILKETDALAENILCLTYTDAGTIAMRKRLLSFIGPDAYKVQINTFHGFCNLVIQENLDVFGYRNLDPVSELEELQFMRQFIDELPKSHVLKRYTGDVYFEIARLKSLFDVMKKEDWNADYLTQKIEEFLKDLPTRDEFIYKRRSKKKDGTYAEAGEVKTERLQEMERKMELLKAGVALFEPYQQLLRSKNRYDFNDMILWVIKAFKEQEPLLLNYQEKYQYILVDEYQDTSGAQNDLLSLLLNYWDSPNIFTVGDDDQSIYRFQGASVENIQAFVNKFVPNLKMITLTENYRSVQPILDAAAKLISANTGRIDPNKTLTAANPERKNVNEKPQVRIYKNEIHESAGIANDIIQLRDKGVPLSEIAILYRKHAQADELIRFLNFKGITVNTRRRLNILAEPMVEKIIKVMEYLSLESKKPHTGEHLLFEILHFQEFDLPIYDIARLSLDIARKNFKEVSTSWREELRNYGRINNPDLFSAQTAHPFNAFVSSLEKLISSVLNQTAQETIHHIIRDCNILASALASNERTWQMEMLQTFFDFIKTECSKNPSHTLSTLTDLLLMMQKEGIALNAEKVWYNDQGVNLITAHSAKGLEFDHVFVIGCNTKYWDKPVADRGFKLPDNLFEIKAEETEEQRRLFYVAITRARKTLVLSYPEADMNGKELEPSQFLAQLQEANSVDTATIPFDAASIEDYLINSLPESQSVIPDNLIDHDFTQSLLEKYSLSVTHLNNYLKCPVAFYFTNFIRVPAPKSASMTFGSAIHYALEQHFKKMNAHEAKEFPDSESLVKDFRWFMRRNMDSFTEADYKRRLEYGELILPLYASHYEQVWNKITSVEKPYRNVVVNGIPLNGKLDKLEFDGNRVNVVDYKTGSYKNAKNKFNRPNPEAIEKAMALGAKPSFEDQYGGDYWRQAVFYKLLIDYDTQKNWEMRSSEFDFIEPLTVAGPQGSTQYEFKKEKVNITPEDTEWVKSQIGFAYNGIKNKEFTKGCDEEDCNWCNFVKNYYQARNSSKSLSSSINKS